MDSISRAATSGAAKPPKASVARKRLVLPFEDNRYLAELLGEYDAHLALIEDRLGIEAHAHGNVVILSGSEAACEIARSVLEQLYARVARGEQVGPGDFDGLIRHGREQTPGTLPNGQAQITTRRRVIKARTPAQSNYIRALEKNRSRFRTRTGRHRQDIPRRRLCRALP